MYTPLSYVLSFLLAMASLTLLPGTALAQNAQPRNGNSIPKVTRSPGAIHVLASSVRLDLDLSQGLYSLHWGTQGEIRGANCAVLLSDGSQVKATDGTTHVCDPADITPVRDGFGTGLRLQIHHRQEGKPELRQTLWIYRNTPAIYVQVEAISSTTIATNRISPLLIEPGPMAGIDLDAGDPLQVLFVPFDNDAFVRYTSHDWGPQADSYEVTAFYDNRSRHGIVVGSVTHDVWKTGFAIRGIDKQQVGSLEVYGGATGKWSHDSQPHGMVRGTVIASPRIFLGCFDDWRDGMEAFGKANAAVSPPLQWKGGVPFGWNSWAAHKEKVTAEDVAAASDFVKQKLQPHGFESGHSAFINTDSYWDFIPADKFKAAAAHIHANGQKAGIYWAPFVGWSDDLHTTVEGTDGRYTYQDIVLKDGQGHPVPKLDGGWPLDPTHPGTQARIDWQFHRFVEWGFDFVKLDFMTHGALEGVHFDPQVTTGIAAYNVGMKRIVAALDPKRIGRPFFISLSIAPLFPSGYAHSRRISCDAFATIGSTEYMLNALTYGWWAGGALYAYNDPDHTVVYRVHGDTPVSEAEGRSRLNASVIAGTVLLDSDDLTNDDARRRVETLFTNSEINALARSGRSFRPVEGDTSGSAADVFLMNGPDAFYVAVFNFNNSAPMQKTLNLARLGLKPALHYTFRDLWTHQVTSTTDSFSVSLDAAASTIFRVTAVNISLLQGAIGHEPKGWIVSTPGYTGLLVQEGPPPGQRSVLLQKEVSPVQSSSFGNLMRTFSAVPYRGKKIRFRASVRFEKTGKGGFLRNDEAHLWMRVDRANNAGVSFFDNMEKRPITVKEYHSYEIVGPIAEDAEFINIGLLLVGDGKTWMRDAAVEVFDGTQWTALPEEKLSVRDTPVSKALDPQREKALVAQLDERAVALKTVEAGHGFEDMLPLDKIVGDARIVALGEASHGTREFFQMKHRMLEYLVNKKGFTVFAIEANWPETEAADRYIKTGAGDVTAALDAMYFWTWHTREVADLIQWMRGYNERPGDHPRLTFTGFDMQTPDVAARQLLEYIGKADKNDLSRVTQAYAHITSGHLAPGGKASPEALEADRTQAEAILKLLDERRKALEDATSSADYLHARQCARIVLQAATMNTPGQNPYAVRDQSMAENVRWIAEQAYPGQKIVVWAHNGHVGDSTLGGGASMGHWLKQMFGTHIVIFGFGFDFGQIRAITFSGSKATTGPILQTLPPAIAGSAEAVLRQARAPIYLLDFRALPPSSPLAVWLAEDQLFREPGAAYDPDQPNAFFSPVKLSKTFDGLFFIRESHASMLLPYGVPPKRQEKN
jgi:alpha-galactosidase